MLSPVVIGALIQTGIVVILCVGFTFTYMVEKFPNFAHTAIATFGTVLSYSLVKIYGFNPYSTIPFSMLLCGLISLLLYVIVVRPIKATGARDITLTFAFLALAQMMASLVNVYSYWYMLNQERPAIGFNLVSSDFSWEGYPGVLLATLPMCIGLVVVLWFFLTRVKQGIAFRAVAEDEALASSLGVNINAIHHLTWLITGSLAGLAGAMIPLWRYTGLGYNDEFLVLVMAGSVMGGINSVAGALIGGFLAATSQKLLGALAIAIYGVEASAYEALYPTILIAAILMIEPEGIMGFFDHPHNPAETIITSTNRLRNYLVKIIHVT
jgi:branched-subunit amino acid ABC-type transport system permease component